MSLPAAERLAWNWGTDPGRDFWWVPGTCTYINGIMVTIDSDYEMAYLLEVCDQKADDTWVTHLAIEVRHVDVANWSWHEHRPYPFFERPAEVTHFDIHRWFVNWYECNQEVRS